MSMPDLFREAVHEAHAGNREKSRRLLRELLQGEPRHEMAWLWLGRVSPTLNEQIIALETAQAINPTRPETAVSLHKLRQQKRAQQDPKLDGMYRQAILAYKDGRSLYARNLLQHIVQKKKNHRKAWFALGQIEPNIEDRVFALTVGLSLYPNHEKAKRRLEKIEQQETLDHFSLAQRFEAFALQDTAVSHYQKAQQTTNNHKIQQIAQEKVASLQNHNSKVLKFTTPTTHLIRLSAGPIIIYLLLILTDSGLNPFNISWRALLGVVVVALGSLLIVGANNVPHHPIWKPFWGSDGLNRKSKRHLITSIGLFLLLSPFFTLLLFSFVELTAYYATE